MEKLLKLKKIDYSIMEVEFAKNRRPQKDKPYLFFYIGKMLKNNTKKLVVITFNDNTIIEITVQNNLKIKDRKDNLIIDTSKQSYNEEDINIKKIKNKIFSGIYEVISDGFIEVTINNKVKYIYSLVDMIDFEYSKKSVKAFAKEAKQQYHIAKNSRRQDI